MNTNQITFPLAKRVDKAWGYELELHNGDGYCGKILHLDSYAKFSLHFHIEKHETWFVASGTFILNWIDPITARTNARKLVAGDIIVIPPGNCHQLEAIVESEIFEVSTPHYDHDSYRVEPGDSQTAQTT